MPGDAELGRVVDPAALDVADGPRGRLRVQIPEAWLATKLGIDVLIPRRLACARCDGGGCDACARSGAVRVPDALVGSRLRVPLSRRTGTEFQVRLTQPFGEGVPIDQLLVHVRLGEPATEGVWPAEMGRLRRLRRRDWIAFALIALIPLVGFLIMWLTKPK